MIKSYEDIKLYFDELRIENIEKAFDRKQKVYAAYPELKAIDNEIADNYTNLNLDTASIKKKAAELKSKKEKFLKDKKIDPNYEEPIYTCPKCNDTGYVKGRKCSCYRQLEAKIYNNVFDFDKIKNNFSFDKIDFNKYNQSGTKPPSGRDYKEYMIELIKHMKEHLAKATDSLSDLSLESSSKSIEPFNAIFNGQTGVGKTFLAKTIGAEAYRRGMTVLYIKASDYIDSFFNKDNKNVDELANTVDLLILDDLGKETNSDFSFTRMFNIIDKRLENDKSTIITTNYGFNELREIYDDTIMSRVYNRYFKYRLFGDDLRSEVNE